MEIKMKKNFFSFDIMCVDPPSSPLMTFLVHVKEEKILDVEISPSFTLPKEIFSEIEEEPEGKKLSDLFSSSFLNNWLRPNLRENRKTTLEEKYFFGVFLNFPSGYHGASLIALEKGISRIFIRDFSAWYALYQNAKIGEELFSMSRKAIFTTDCKGKICKINSAFSRITGYGEAEIEGYLHSIFYPEKRNSKLYKDIYDSLEKYGSWEGLFWDRRKSGEMYQQYLSLGELDSPNDMGPRYVGIFSDMPDSSYGKKPAKRKRILLDRFSFLQALNEMLERGKSPQGLEITYLAILYIQFSKLQQINDFYENASGSLALLSIARELEEICRTSDSLLGYMGENTLVLGVPHIHAKEEILSFIRKIWEILEHPQIFQQKVEMHIPVNIGISRFPDDAREPEKLVHYAEVAAEWRNINHRKGNPIFFSRNMMLHRRQRASMEIGLEKALEEKELFLLYQPKIDLKTKSLVGAEALLRWKFKAQGQIVSPGDFIPLAEQSGSILPIGKWVLQEVFGVMESWKKDYAWNSHVSVNVSALQFAQPDLEPYLEKLFAKNDIEPHNLTLELTENTVIGMDCTTLSLLERFQTKGMGISIDDFGTGYSSLGYLQNLPVTELKVDKAFMRSLDRETRARALLKSIISLGTSLGLNVIVEGVETTFQESILDSFNMPLGVQGYLYGPPMNQTAFENRFFKTKKP